MHFWEEPPSPRTNFFKPGMKLGAANIMNPGLICPATVDKFEGDYGFATLEIIRLLGRRLQLLVSI
jgi:hypothetical protein